MATVSDLNIRLGLITRDFDRNLAKVERDLRNAGGRLSRLGSDLTLAISAPLAAFGVSAIQAAGDVEALRLAMRATFEGAGRSIREADAELEALRKSALAPGLDFEQAVKASVRLQNVGFTAENARSSIEQIANTIATTGGTAQDLDEVTNQFSQMIGKGKIFQDDLKIIVGRMPKLAQLMKETFGTTTAEGLNALGVDARTFVDTMVAKMQELPRVTGGIKNSIVNLGSAIRNSLAGFGEEINRIFNLGKQSDELSARLAGLVGWFKALDDSTKRLIVEFGVLLVAAGPLVKVFGALYGGTAQLVSVFRSAVTTGATFAKFIASLSGPTTVVAGTYNSLAQAVRAGTDSIRGAQEAHKGLAHAIFLGSSAAQSAGTSLRGVAVASAASVAEASRLKNISGQFIAPIAAEATRAGTSIRGLGAASLASVADASRMKVIASQYIAPITAESARAALAAYRLRVAILAATGGLAAIVLGIAGAVYLLADRFNAAEFASEQFNQAQKTTIEQAAKETGELNKNFDILRSVTAGTDDRKKAIVALQSAYPDYLNNINLEKSTSAELTKIQKGLNDEILRGVAERQKAAAVNAVYEKQAQILLRIQQIQRTGDISTGEASLINTGDLIRNGSSAAAVIQKLQQQVRDLGDQANVTAKDFDKAFGLASREIDPLLQKEYDARAAAEEARDAFLGLADKVKKADENTRVFTGSIAAAGDGLSKKMKAALAGVNANLDAFDERLKISGPSADSAAQRNELLTKSIDRLLKAGFTATSEQVQSLNTQLKAGTEITEEQRRAYDALRESWSKPVEIKVPEGIPTLPQANPLGVGQDQPAPGQPQASPVDALSLGALNESLVTINALTAGLQNMVATGLTPAQAIIQGLRTDTISFNEAWTAMAETVAANGTAIQQIAVGVGQSFNEAATSGANSFADFARSFIRSAAKIIKTQIQIAVTNAALSALQNTPFPYNIILAGVAGAAAAALFEGLVNKITAPKLAAGGVIKKPTFAMLGEYPGASSNPEIAAPESKLRNIFRSEQSAGSLALESKVKGDDLYILVKRAETNRNRFG